MKIQLIEKILNTSGIIDDFSLPNFDFANILNKLDEKDQSNSKFCSNEQKDKEKKESIKSTQKDDPIYVGDSNSISQSRIGVEGFGIVLDVKEEVVDLKQVQLIADQILQAVSIYRSHNTTTLKMEFQLGSLGPVKLELSLLNGRIFSCFTVDDPNGYQLLSHAAHDLETALEKHGLQIEPVRVQLEKDNARHDKPQYEIEEIGEVNKNSTKQKKTRFLHSRKTIYVA